MGGLTLGGLILEGSCKTAQGGYRLGATKPLSDVEEQLVREPYTCERLTQIRGGYRALTGSCVALQFDFCNPEVSNGTDVLVPSALPACGLISMLTAERCVPGLPWKWRFSAKLLLHVVQCGLDFICMATLPI